MIHFPPPLLPPPLVAQNDRAHKDLSEKTQHTEKKSLVNSQLSSLQDPPLPPSLVVAQTDTARKAAEEKIQNTAENSSVNTQLSMLQDQLRPANTQSADKLYFAKITENKLSYTSYQTNRQSLNWLKLSCSQCSNNQSNFRRQGIHIQRLSTRPVSIKYIFTSFIIKLRHQLDCSPKPIKQKRK